MSDSFPVQLRTSITNQTQNKVDDLHSKAVGKGLMPGITCAITSCRKEERGGGEGERGLNNLQQLHRTKYPCCWVRMGTIDQSITHCSSNWTESWLLLGLIFPCHTTKSSGTKDVSLPSAPGLSCVNPHQYSCVEGSLPRPF